jgi:hypothetical protein
MVDAHPYLWDVLRICNKREWVSTAALSVFCRLTRLPRVDLILRLLQILKKIGGFLHLHSYRLKNFRRLKDAHIELADDISIFVGSNNSGKTSATQAIYSFVAGGKDRFSLYDFSSSCWELFRGAGNINLADPIPDDLSLPSIDLDLWFEVAASDLYLVIPLLPSTAWEGTKVGIRVSFTARSSIDLIRNYQNAKVLICIEN